MWKIVPSAVLLVGLLCVGGCSSSQSAGVPMRPTPTLASLSISIECHRVCHVVRGSASILANIVGEGTVVVTATGEGKQASRSLTFPLVF